MTDKALNEYYEYHRDRYMSLVNACTSVPELLLKIEIYGKKWTQWDWTLFFSSMFTKMISSIMHSPSQKADEQYCQIYSLYRDFFDAIDNTNELDKVLTDKQVILNTIYVINGNAKFIQYNMRQDLCVLLAHVFKKFPALWNMSWMYAKFHDATSKRWQKYHRLRKAVYTTSSKSINDPYYKSNQFCKDFLRLYLAKKEDNEGEEEKKDS